MSAVLHVFQRVHHSGRVVNPGQYLVGEQITEELALIVLSCPKWGKLVGEMPSLQADQDELQLDLTADNDAIKAVLDQLSEHERDDLWRSIDADVMADFLVNRAGRERKDGWQPGAMGNMIEKHVGL